MTSRMAGWRRYGPSRSAAVILALAATVAVGALAPSARAHATLVRSIPADSVSLARAPSNVRLWFSEPVLQELSSVQLYDARHQAVAGVEFRVGTEPRLLTASLPRLPAGAYTLDWRVLSDGDVHFTQGSIAFAVGPHVIPRVRRDVAASSPEAAEVVLRWLSLTFFVLALGALSVAALVLDPVVRQPRNGPIAEAAARAKRRVLMLVCLAAAHAFALGFVMLYWEATQAARSLPGVSFLGAGERLLTDTRWGVLWLVREGCMLALAILVLLGLRARPPSGKVLAGVAAPVVFALATTQALTSHAAALEQDRVPALVADAVHVLAASAWIGGLVAILIACLPPVGFHTEFARTCFLRFSPIAALSVALLVATGLFSMSQQVASLDALVTSLYGQGVLVKTGLLATAGALGLVTSILVHSGPSSALGRLLRRREGMRPRRRLIALEAGLGVAILLFAALLTASPPARGPEFLPARSVPGALTQSAGDLLVSISVKPNQPGPNVVTVRTANLRRPALVGIRQVVVRFASGADGPTDAALVVASRVGPGVYRVVGEQLGQEGPWRLDALVKRKGLPDIVAPFDWEVASPIPPRRVLISDRPLEPLLTRIAAALLFGLIAATALYCLLRRPRAGTAQTPGSGTSAPSPTRGH